MKPNPVIVGAALAIGVGFGTALGVALDNLGLWIALGAGVGVAIGAGVPGGNKTRHAALPSVVTTG